MVSFAAMTGSSSSARQAKGKRAEWKATRRLDEKATKGGGDGISLTGLSFPETN
jgi:hypothetical protein